jgi:hypothetical protein
MASKQEDDLHINKGVELMLRNKKINKTEEPSIFKLCFRKMVSFFTREFHFSFEFQIKKRNS